MIELSWTDFDAGVASLVRDLGPHVDAFKRGVVGLPRGGLPLAVALSHRLGVPLIDRPRADCLVVDDALATGRTLRAIDTPRVTFAVWVTKRPLPWVISAVEVDPEELVLFPWEDKAGALTAESMRVAGR